MTSSASPSRLVLFDIDGTLLTSGGAATKTFNSALEEIAGKPVATEGYSMAGKTDGLIVRELLGRAGIGPEPIESMMGAVLERYLARFPQALAGSTKAALFPGVRPLLEHLAVLPSVLLGLLTGNLERGAEIKLTRFGIQDLFRVGAFGSDSEDRRALVAVAVERARALSGVQFSGRSVVIVGDTPLDIDCGRAAGATTVAVATGPYSIAELMAHEPNCVFPDFTDTEKVLAAIAGDGAGKTER